MVIPMPFEEFKSLTQVNRESDFWDDRADELAGFFRVSRDQAKSLYRDLNVDKRVPLPPNLFEKQDHASVIASYLDRTFFQQSITRLMLHYSRLELTWRVLTALSRDRASWDYSGTIMMDYGCGAADYAIGFSIFGAKPVLVDIEGGPVEFASYRLKRRDILHSVIKISANIEYPDLPRVDIINAAEVLEHVSDPAYLIELFASAVQPAGYLTFSDYPVRPKSVGGSHLKSAAESRDRALQTLQSYFKPIWADASVGYIYKLAG